MTLTAVPVVANADPPAPQPITERAMTDFAASVRSSPMAGMPNLANPAALAGEVFSHLRGFVEKSQLLQRPIPRVQQSSGTDSPGFVPASFSGEPSADPQRSLAADGREPDEAGGGLSQAPKADARGSLEELQRTLDKFMEISDFMVETTVVTQGAAMVPHLVNTLLKGQ
jgi:hypothetical protein